MVFVQKNGKYFTLIPNILRFFYRNSSDTISTVQRKREEKEPCLNMFLN